VLQTHQALDLHQLSVNTHVTFLPFSKNKNKLDIREQGTVDTLLAF